MRKSKISISRNINMISSISNTMSKGFDCYDFKPNTEWTDLPLFDRSKWECVRFGDVVANVNETCDSESAGIERFIGLEHMEPGSLHVRAWGDVADGTTFTRRCRPGQVLFGKRRAYQRKVAVAEFDAVVSGDIYVFTPKDERLLPELLPFICMSERFFQHAVGTSAGSLSPRTNWSSLADYELELPPLDHQRGIAEILWAVDAVGENFRKVHDSVLLLRKSAHNEVLSRGLSNHNGSSPVDWMMSTVGQACCIENNLRKPINASERASMPGDYPYYGPTGILDYIDEYRADGDYVLIGEDGDHFLKYDTWSMTQLVHGRFNVNNHAHLMCGTSICRTEWVFYYFKHRDITPFLSRQGAGRLKLQKATLEKMPIVLPPLPEQDLIIKYLREIDNTLDRVSSYNRTNQQLLCTLVNEFTLE